jgi:hypothetical protein
MLGSSAERSAQSPVRRCYRRRYPRPKTSPIPTSRNCHENDMSSISTAEQQFCQTVVDTHHDHRSPETLDSTPPAIVRSIPSISFPIPPSVPSDWLIRTTPLILVKYLLYTRGLIPMTVEQLFSCVSGEVHATNIAGTSTSSPTPSLRRKIERCCSQIHQLFHEWPSLESSWNMLHRQYPVDGPKERPFEVQDQHPAFVLISLGPSFTQSRELYLLDLQAWEWHPPPGPSLDHNSHTLPSHHVSVDDNCGSIRMEGMLARRLISSLMMQDDCPTNTLPSKSSPSFRLWLTVAYDREHRCQGSSSPVERGADGIGRCTTINHPPDLDGILPEFIHRPRLPLMSSSETTLRATPIRPQNVVSIQLIRKTHHQRQYKIEVDQEQQLENATSILEPTSSRLIWMSLPTSIKGFRL